MTTRMRRTRSNHLGGTVALREFLATELAGGVVLLVAAATALVWANSQWQASYAQLWGTVLRLEVGSWQLELDLRHWVNEGLMAFFFLVVGLEIKRELLQGELRERRRAALPVVAALGGMAVPALLYAVLNAGGDGAPGWGIPMATDIAFALGVLAVVLPRAPSQLRLFLLTLAIVDDLGAILVIAFFYAGELDGWWLALAAAALVVVYLLRQAGFTFTPVFVAVGSVVWLGLHEGGVHATLAGVAMGLLAPSSPKLTREIVGTRDEELLDVFSPEAARTTVKIARQSVSQLEWLEHGIHPWSSLLVVPLFALANAGIVLDRQVLGDSLASAVTLGVVLGLVLGKPLGIVCAAWLACRLGIAERPAELGWRGIAGVAALGGVGFTVSLFMSELAFTDASAVAEAKVGIVGASVLAVVAGAVVLRTGRRREVRRGSRRAG